MLKSLLLLALFTTCVFKGFAQQKQSFNQNWEFIKDADTTFSSTLINKNKERAWSKISLPHTANIEPIEKIVQQWQGICFYRKFFSLPVAAKGQHVALQFDAAMQVADVYLNGKHIFKHEGGYLPFYINISDAVNFGSENSLVVKLDNRDNPLIPPGKPLKDLDFNYYSGIYRDVWLITKPKTYITNAVEANKTAGGGVLLNYENITKQSAKLSIKTHVTNDNNTNQNTQLRVSMIAKDGKTVAQSLSKVEVIKQGDATTITQVLNVANPKLWSPDSPYLYSLSVEVLANGKVLDKEVIKTGVRTFRFDSGALYMNNQKINIRGTNRHQEYPYLGNALSNNAQYRDAWKIKDAGFNFVRTSHYPQAPAFLDACDELGLLVMDAIPGWQFVGNEIFQQNSYQDIRDMIRRDRNHPSIILWEASLNESRMPKEYMHTAHKIVHEELPFANVYSAGWVDEVFDVFLPARQHGKAPNYWKNYKKDKPLLIAEYGDWEYYAQNAGFNQTAYGDLKAEERTSRQLRGFGQKALQQQALNFQEAHNDNLNGKSVGDANWLMFDYKRGYAADIESSGIMDITRLPKFAFYFYKSQINPVVNSKSEFNKPMVFISSYWKDEADSIVKIYSNCDEVELFVNGKSIGKQSPDKDKNSTNLKHPPYTFKVGQFKAGSVKAIGFINNKAVVQSEQKTAAEPAAIKISADYSGKPLKTGQNDVIFIYASITDNEGTVVSDAKTPVEFIISGGAETVGPHVVNAEAGIATVLIKAGSKPGEIKIIAKAKGLKDGELTIKSE